MNLNKNISIKFYYSIFGEGFSCTFEEITYYLLFKSVQLSASSGILKSFLHYKEQINKNKFEEQKQIEIRQQNAKTKGEKRRLQQMKQEIENRKEESWYFGVDIEKECIVFSKYYYSKDTVALIKDIKLSSFDKMMIEQMPMNYVLALMQNLPEKGVNVKLMKNVVKQRHLVQVKNMYWQVQKEDLGSQVIKNQLSRVSKLKDLEQQLKDQTLLDIEEEERRDRAKNENQMFYIINQRVLDLIDKILVECEEEEQRLIEIRRKEGEEYQEKKSMFEMILRMNVDISHMVVSKMFEDFIKYKKEVTIDLFEKEDDSVFVMTFGTREETVVIKVGNMEYFRKLRRALGISEVDYGVIQLTDPREFSLLFEFVFGEYDEMVDITFHLH